MNACLSEEAGNEGIFNNEKKCNKYLERWLLFLKEVSKTASYPLHCVNIIVIISRSSSSSSSSSSVKPDQHCCCLLFFK